MDQFVHNPVLLMVLLPKTHYLTPQDFILLSEILQLAFGAVLLSPKHLDLADDPTQVLLAKPVLLTPQHRHLPLNLFEQVFMPSEERLVLELVVVQVRLH